MQSLVLFDIQIHLIVTVNFLCLAALFKEMVLAHLTRV
jgi:hypothetical protein